MYNMAGLLDIFKRKKKVDILAFKAEERKPGFLEKQRSKKSPLDVKSKYAEEIRREAPMRQITPKEKEELLKLAKLPPKPVPEKSLIPVIRPAVEDAYEKLLEIALEAIFIASGKKNLSRKELYPKFLKHPGIRLATEWVLTNFTAYSTEQFYKSFLREKEAEEMAYKLKKEKVKGLLAYTFSRVSQETEYETLREKIRTLLKEYKEKHMSEMYVIDSIGQPEPETKKRWKELLKRYELGQAEEGAVINLIILDMEKLHPLPKAKPYAIIPDDYEYFCRKVRESIHKDAIEKREEVLKEITRYLFGAMLFPKNIWFTCEIPDPTIRKLRKFADYATEVFPYQVEEVVETELAVPIPIIEERRRAPYYPTLTPELILECIFLFRKDDYLENLITQSGKPRKKLLEIILAHDNIDEVINTMKKDLEETRSMQKYKWHEVGNEEELRRIVAKAIGEFAKSTGQITVGGETITMNFYISSQIKRDIRDILERAREIEIRTGLAKAEEREIMRKGKERLYKLVIEEIFEMQAIKIKGKKYRIPEEVFRKKYFPKIMKTKRLYDSLDKIVSTFIEKHARAGQKEILLRNLARRKEEKVVREDLQRILQIIWRGEPVLSLREQDEAKLKEYFEWDFGKDVEALRIRI